MDPLIKSVQERLAAEGFDPGPADGVIGRRTITAIEDYQKAKQLPIKYPGTLGPITLGSLFPGNTDLTTKPLPAAVSRPWLDLAIQKKGLNEDKDYAALSKFLKSDGDTVGDPRKNPWCGDFVETCIALTLPREPLPTNPYLARNWLNFGEPCEPQLGAVLIFWRGQKNGLNGHVTFDVGKGKGVFYGLGGNQTNGIKTSPVDEGRLLGARWPKTMPSPSTLFQPTMKGGKLSLNES